MSLIIECNTVLDWHITDLCRRMRTCDRKEAIAGTGLPIEQVVHFSVETSAYGGVVFYKAKEADVMPPLDYQLGLCCIWGIGPVPGDERTGIPWLLGTDEMDKHPIHLLRASRRNFAMVQKVYDRLENYVHAENVRSIRFLEYLGFAIGEPEPWGVAGQMFRSFSWSRKLCVNR